jgi:hypothetical protein
MKVDSACDGYFALRHPFYVGRFTGNWSICCRHITVMGVFMSEESAVGKEDPERFEKSVFRIE